MTRVAIYARYSSERQNERSIADQLSVCMRHAAAKGWSVVETYSDAAISGAAMANRPGLLDALAAAEAGVFNVLLTEDEDRIARNLEHLAHVASRLRFAGVTLATLSTDAVEDMHVAFKGLIGAEYLKNLSQKTKRGMCSNAEKGLATGSRLYGYRSLPGGAIEIVAAEADVVRRIFSDYIAGVSPRAIADRLNRESIPGPRGGLWSHSSICGSRQRANGILHTELYAGVKVWNRMEVRKDPRTGKRTPRMRPEAEWQRTEVPHLAIVDAETWQTTRALKLAAAASAPFERRRTPPWLLSGLVKCGRCGGSYTVYTSGKLVCATYREKGAAACSNRRTPMRNEIERRVIEGLKTRLLTPAVVEEAMREHRIAAEERRRIATGQRLPLERRLAETKRTIERIVDAVEQGRATNSMLDRMMTREAEKTELEAQLAALDADQTPAVTLHPNAGAMFSELVGQLQDRLAKLGKNADGQLTDREREFIDAVRALVVRIDVEPESDAPRAPLRINLVGNLAAFVSDEVNPSAQSGLPSKGLGKLVAGGGIEPPTCGL